MKLYFAWHQDALKEPWLEPSHDANVLACGELQKENRLSK